MSWQTIRGQDRPSELLRRSAAAGRLPHALLFVGPPGVGKRLVARALAAALFCERPPSHVATVRLLADACGECASCRMVRAGTHPDFLVVACPEGKSELPIELLVGDLENRGRAGLCHDLWLRPMSASRRVALIDDADRMSTESANALLKTLEEPPAYAVIILIAAEAASILPTIRSRCQAVRFPPLSDEDVAALVTQLGWTDDAAEARTVAEQAGGSLVVAQQLLNPQLRAVRAALYEGLNKPRLEAYTMTQAALRGLEALGGDTAGQRTHAQWIVRFLVEYFQNALRAGLPRSARPAEGGEADGAANVTDRRDAVSLPQDGDPRDAADRMAASIDRCLDAEDQLAGNVSIPLCLEALLGDLATIGQPVGSR